LSAGKSLRDQSDIAERRLIDHIYIYCSLSTDKSPKNLYFVHRYYCTSYPGGEKFQDMELYLSVLEDAIAEAEAGRPTPFRKRLPTRRMTLSSSLQRDHVQERGMVWYGTVWYGLVWYGMIWFDTVWYGMVWYGIVRCGMVWLIWYG
jgi:hypothetical protein